MDDAVDIRDEEVDCAALFIDFDRAVEVRGDADMVGIVSVDSHLTNIDSAGGSIGDERCLILDKYGNSASETAVLNTATRRDGIELTDATETPTLDSVS